MKASELSFADMAALELLPAVINSRHFLHQPYPEAAYDAAARFVYGQADALDAERNRRNNLHEQIVDALRARLERAEASYALVLNMNEDGQFGARVALSGIWEFLGVTDQTAAMQKLRDMHAGLEKIRDFSDSEMRDGDAARAVAVELIGAGK